MPGGIEVNSAASSSFLMKTDDQLSNSANSNSEGANAEGEYSLTSFFQSHHKQMKLDTVCDVSLQPYDAASILAQCMEARKTQTDEQMMP